MREGASHVLHLVTYPLELGEHRVDHASVLLEASAPGVGNLVALAGTFRLDRCVSNLFEVCQRGIHHARTRAVEASRALAKRFDDLVAVRGFLREQREDDELKILRAELAARAKAMPTDVAVPEHAPEHAREAVPPGVPSGAAVLAPPESCKMTVHHAS